MKDSILRELDIGGKEVVLSKDSSFYYVTEGKKLIYKIPTFYITRKTLWTVVDDYVMYLKKQQQEFLTGELPVDKILDDAEKTIRKELTKRLRQFFDDISKEKTNKESFLGVGIFDRLKNIFSDMNKKINDIVKDSFKRLSVQVVDDVEDTQIETPKIVKQELKTKSQLMQKSIADQMIKTKDNILTDIKKSLTDGIAADQPISTIKQGIEHKYNYKNGIGWKADRTIRTELNSANTKLKLLKWLAMGFTKFEWLTREDDKVREKHASKNRRVYDIKKALADVNNWDAYPGKAANCRCSAVLYK